MRTPMKVNLKMRSNSLVDVAIEGGRTIPRLE